MKKGKNHLVIIAFVVFLIIMSYGIFVIAKTVSKQDHIFNEETKEDIKLTTQEIEKGIKINDDGIKYIIDPREIRSGGPPKGGIGVDRGIPALAKENIKFVNVKDADEFIEDNELVLALDYKGEKRVYPLQIMVWHEIANDVIQEEPILITYCPLCGSGIAYERKIEIEGKRVTTRFGTSGKLYNSNLIMYDEKTQTYWQQIGGQGIVGKLTGQELVPIDIDTVVWRDYKIQNPNAKVLSQETGINRDYGRDPYGNYYEDSFLIFPVDQEDNRIHPKTPILGIKVNESFSAYIEENLIVGEEIIDEVGGIKISLIKNPGGDVDITNLETKETIPKERDFWFAWYAFHPTTKLYGVQTQ